MAALDTHHLAQLMVVTLMLSSVSSSSSNVSQAKENCTEYCGDLRIPYPFGTTEGCYLNPMYLITCNESKPLIDEVAVTNISLATGQLEIFAYASRDCYEGGHSTNRSFRGVSSGNQTIFTVNGDDNMFTAVGCDTYAFLVGYRSNQPYITGCISQAQDLDAVVNGSCSGVCCCQAAIPPGLNNVSMGLTSLKNHTLVEDYNPCSYAFMVENGKFNFSLANLTSPEGIEKLPMVMDWVIGNETCEVAAGDLSSYACKTNNSYCEDLEPGSPMGYRCFCKDGYDGNPYLDGISGCTDIDECWTGTHECVKESVCRNTPPGNYTCECKQGYVGDGRINGERCRANNSNDKFYKLIAGVSVGIVTALVVIGWLYLGYRRRKSIQMREKFFKKNGGILLQQQLTGTKTNNSTRIFSVEELRRATNDFDERKIIGQGGFGTVYKGYFSDNNNTLVAIKKSKYIDRTQIESFINEVIVLSQINHRNVVKLLGCCLETETPLLVYEFISNGTLSEHIHNTAAATRAASSTLSLEVRLKIAAETAWVLSYLHTTASPPIIHRDIKSTNILLDKNYTAKVSDFGVSRLCPSDQSQLSTVVQGTMGYLDPEYMLTGKLTEKSDVYSFGVLLVELITGKKVVSFERPEYQRGLANHFLTTLKEGRLQEILEAKLAQEGCNDNIELLEEVAVVAKRCLSMKGEDRPTMKEVAVELEGFWRQIKTSDFDTETCTEEMAPLLLVEQSERHPFDGSSSSSIITTDAGGYDGMSEIVHLQVSGGR